MHQYEARALKLKPRNAVPTVRKEVKLDHEVKTLKPEYVWPGRRAAVYPTEYKPKPHPRQLEMREKKPL